MGVHPSLATGRHFVDAGQMRLTGEGGILAVAERCVDEAYCVGVVEGADLVEKRDEWERFGCSAVVVVA